MIFCFPPCSGHDSLSLILCQYNYHAAAETWDIANDPVFSWSIKYSRFGFQVCHMGGDIICALW